MFLFSNTLVFLVASILYFGEVALADIFKKCSIKDDTCLNENFQSLIDTLVKEGLPKMGIDKIDPLVLKDVSVKVLGILNVTLLEGTIEGIKSCKLEKYTNDIDRQTSSLHFICDKIIIFGNYELDLFGALLQTSPLGDKKTHGNGYGKIVADKVEINLEYPYYFEKNDNGIHFKFDTSKIDHTFNILEKATFEADNLIDGDPEASKKAISYMNENWKLLLQSFGKDFIDKVIEYINLYVVNIFNNFRTEDFIIEDLTPYVKQ